jgi:hypothetical protein
MRTTVIFIITIHIWPFLFPKVFFQRHRCVFLFASSYSFSIGKKLSLKSDVGIAFVYESPLHEIDITVVYIIIYNVHIGDTKTYSSALNRKDGLNFGFLSSSAFQPFPGNLNRP